MPKQNLGLRQGAAALGVILSLLLAGYEIRQNTQIARATAVQTTHGQIVQWQTGIALDAEWIRIQTFLGREGGTYADLTPIDQVCRRLTESRSARQAMSPPKKRKAVGATVGAAEPGAPAAVAQRVPIRVW